MRLMTMKYGNRCRKCSAPLPANAVAYGEPATDASGRTRWTFECCACHDGIGTSASPARDARPTAVCELGDLEEILEREATRATGEACVEPARVGFADIAANAAWRFK